MKISNIEQFISKSHKKTSNFKNQVAEKRSIISTFMYSSDL